MPVVLHLLPAAAYAASGDQAVVVDCPSGGFIHLTENPEVLVQVANTFVRAVPGDFVVLEVDPAQLTAELRWEPPEPPAAPGTAMRGRLFPHLYGPLNREAVVGVRPAVRAADGTFVAT